MRDLALEIGEIHYVEIEHADLADARGGEIHDDGRTETTGTDAQHASGADFLLPGQAHFRQNQVP